MWKWRGKMKSGVMSANKPDNDQHLSHTLTHMQWNLKIPSWGAASLKRRCLAPSNLSAPQVQNVEMYVQLFLIISRPQLWFQLLLCKGSAKSINYSVDHFLATKNVLFFYLCISLSPLYCLSHWAFLSADASLEIDMKYASLEKK